MAVPINIPFVFEVGQPVVANQHNSNNTSIANFVTQLQNGQNYGTGVIGTTTIAPGAITSALIANGNVTGDKLEGSIVLTGTPNIGTALASTLTIGSVPGLTAPTNGALVQGNVVFHLAISPLVANYVLALTDDGKLLEFNAPSAVSVTIPLDTSVDFPIGTQITFIQTGAGQISFVPIGGVTLNSNPANGRTRGIWTSAVLIKRAANTWILLGDLSS